MIAGLYLTMITAKVTIISTCNLAMIIQAPSSSEHIKERQSLSILGMIHPFTIWVISKDDSPHPQIPLLPSPALNPAGPGRKGSPRNLPRYGAPRAPKPSKRGELRGRSRVTVRQSRDRFAGSLKRCRANLAEPWDVLGRRGVKW